MKMKTVFASLAIIGLGFVVARLLVALAPEADRGAGTAAPTVVEVVEISTQPTLVQVTATGTVEPAESIEIVPEVTGRITWHSPKLMPGGRFEKGEALARIDSREYALAVQQEQARVRSAELELELERGRGDIAVREWELLKGKGAAANPLALRESQREASEINLEAAKSGLARAKLSLERASLRAPFNSTVVSESLDIGQRVAPTSSVARLVGTDEFWVRVGVRVEDLSSIAIPGLNAEAGSAAKISQRLADGTLVVREGVVVRLVEQLDPQTRRAQVLVSIRNPLDLGPEGLPLLPGAFVEVEIEGREVDGIAALPQGALYDGDTIWVVRDEMLAPMKVTVRFARGDTVFVTGEIDAGTQLVTSPLSTPIAGTKVEASNVATAARGQTDG